MEQLGMNCTELTIYRPPANVLCHELHHIHCLLNLARPIFLQSEVQALCNALMLVPAYGLQRLSLYRSGADHNIRHGAVVDTHVGQDPFRCKSKIIFQPLLGTIQLFLFETGPWIC